jgi:hypothetical protein
MLWAQTKKPHANGEDLLVEHLEKSSPLIFEEIKRWRYLLRDEYIEFKRAKERRKKLVAP